MTIQTQSDFDKLVATGTKPGVTYSLGGNFTTNKTIRVADATVIQPLSGVPSVKWIAPASPDSAVFALQGVGAKVMGLGIDGGGCDAFAVSGKGHLIARNSFKNANDVIRGNTGCDDIIIDSNRAPDYSGYFAYFSGRKTASAGGIITDYVTNIHIIGNVIGGSKNDHPFRFHDTQHLWIQNNHVNQVNDTLDENGQPKVQCIIKGHDGADWHITDNVFSGKKPDGSYAKFQTVCSFGPLGGKDGGIVPNPKTSEAERSRLLHLLLETVEYARNTHDDVRVDFVPGLRNFDCHDNSFQHVRDYTFSYRPTENTFGNPPVPCDYRATRGEATGNITGNKSLRLAGNAKPMFTGLPTDVKQSGNELDGTKVA